MNWFEILYVGNDLAKIKKKTKRNLQSRRTLVFTYDVILWNELKDALETLLDLNKERMQTIQDESQMIGNL